MPAVCACGKRKIVAARFVRNDRLIDVLMIQAFAALRTSPVARAYYDAQYAKGLEHNDALRRLASRLVGILHGCLKTRTRYDEATAGGHRENIPKLTPPLDIQIPGMSWLTIKDFQLAHRRDRGFLSCAGRSSACVRSRKTPGPTGVRFECGCADQPDRRPRPVSRAPLYIIVFGIGMMARVAVVITLAFFRLGRTFVTSGTTPDSASLSRTRR